MIGKIVSGVVLTECPDGNPRSQVFITFSDGTAFEFWCDDEVIRTASGLDHQSLEEIVRIQQKRDGNVVKAFRPPHQQPANPQRDLLSGES